MHARTGFSKKGARFSQLRNIPNLLTDDRKDKIIENINLKYLLAIGRLLWKTLLYYSDVLCFRDNHLNEQ